MEDDIDSDEDEDNELSKACVSFNNSSGFPLP